VSGFTIRVSVVSAYCKFTTLSSHRESIVFVNILFVGVDSCWLLVWSKILVRALPLVGRGTCCGGEMVTL
jgi:hypothetical protein